MDKMLKGSDLPKEASAQPPGAKKGDMRTRSLGGGADAAGVPGEQGGKKYHEILNDKMSKKLVGC